MYLIAFHEFPVFYAKPNGNCSTQPEVKDLPFNILHVDITFKFMANLFVILIQILLQWQKKIDKSFN